MWDDAAVEGLIQQFEEGAADAPMRESAISRVLSNFKVRKWIFRRVHLFALNRSSQVWIPEPVPAGEDVKAPSPEKAAAPEGEPPDPEDLWRERFQLIKVGHPPLTCVHFRQVSARLGCRRNLSTRK